MKRRLILGMVLAVLCASTPAFAAQPSWARVQEAGLVDLRAYSSMNGYYYSWDPVAKNAILQSTKGHLRFHVGSEYFLRDGRLERMSGKALFRDNAVLAPFLPTTYLAPPLPAVRPDAPRGAIGVSVTQLPATPHKIRKIVIDAGHGGKDAGAVSARGLQEKRVALEVARKVKTALEAGGIQVIMTRSADVFIPLAQRAHIANKNGADLFVSIHANASTSRSLDGFEVYTLSEATDDQALAVERAENSVIRLEPSARADVSHNLKTILWDLKETENRKESLRAARHVADSVTSSVETAAKRVKTANFYVLKWTECPALLVELAYLSNRTDERRLRNAAYKTGIADAIVRGLLQYKKEFDATQGFTQ